MVATSRQEKDRSGCGACAGEGNGRNHAWHSTKSDSAGDRGARGSTAGDAEDEGIGERIAQQRLKGDAGNRKRRAHEDGEQDARQADADEDRSRRWVPVDERAP